MFQLIKARIHVNDNRTMSTFAKTGFYLLSLWLLFIIIIILTIDIPVYWGPDYEWINPFEVIKKNNVPIFCLLFILFDVWFYFFYVKKRLFASAPTYMARVSNLKDQGYEMMSFVATYFLPIFDFDCTSIRQILLYLLLYVVFGVIFVKSNLFYNNPTLILLGFRVYKGDLRKVVDGIEEIKTDVIFVANAKLAEDKYYDYLKASSSIYYLNVE